MADVQVTTDTLPFDPEQPPVSFAEATKGHGPKGPDPGIQLEEFPSVSEVELPPKVEHARKFHTMSKASLRKRNADEEPRSPDHASDDDDTVVDGTHGIEWKTDKVVVTEERRPAFPRTPYAGAARALTADGGSEIAWMDKAAAADDSGSTRREVEGTRGMTVAQKHVAFFDRDGDGKIWPQDTFSGFRELGYGLIISFIGMFFIHFGLSIPTQPYFIPDLFWRIRIPNIHRAKHGSDSETYDTEGRFSPQKFDDIFTKYGDGESLTGGQAVTMIIGNMNAMDPFGWTAAVLEWIATYLLLWPEDGKMMKEDVLGVIDGTLFYRVRDTERQRKHRKHGNGKRLSWVADRLNSLQTVVPSWVPVVGSQGMLSGKRSA